MNAPESASHFEETGNARRERKRGGGILKGRLRLPYALALAVAALAFAAHKLWPFSPPDRIERVAASDAAHAPAPLRPLMNDALYSPLSKPEPGDWIAQHKEWSQTVADFKKSGSNKPGGARKVLYLMPVGEFPAGGRTPQMETLREYFSIFFQMEAKLAPAASEAETGAKRRINNGTGKPQLLTTDILKWLPGKLPPDAFCMLAVTITDLYPDESWNFVFGQATLKERVGVFSLARNDPAFFGADESSVSAETIRALVMRRACQTLSHETGHMFGWRHCKFYQCLMGGSNSQEESDRGPATLCPVCLHKFYLSHAFDPLVRQRALAAFYQRHGMTADEATARSLLKALTPPAK